MIFQELHCYQCQGRGHVSSECPSKKNRKKALKITCDEQSNSENDEGNEGASEGPIISLYTTSSTHNALVASHDPTSENEATFESKDEDFQVTYVKMYNECLNLSKQKGDIIMRLEESEKEKAQLIIELLEAQTKISSLTNEKSILIDKLSTCKNERFFSWCT